MHSRPTFDLLSIRRDRSAPLPFQHSPLSFSCSSRISNAKGHRSQKAAYLSLFHYQLSDSATRKVAYKIHSQNTNTHTICISCKSATFQKINPKLCLEIEQTLTKQTKAVASISPGQAYIKTLITLALTRTHTLPYTHTYKHAKQTNQTLTRKKKQLENAQNKLLYFLILLQLQQQATVSSIF